MANTNLHPTYNYMNVANYMYVHGCLSVKSKYACTYDSGGTTARSYRSVVGGLDLEPVRADLLAIQL